MKRRFQIVVWISLAGGLACNSDSSPCKKFGLEAEALESKYVGCGINLQHSTAAQYEAVCEADIKADAAKEAHYQTKADCYVDVPTCTTDTQDAFDAAIAACGT